MTSCSRIRPWIVVFAVLVAIGALVFCPPDSDGAFAAFDGVYYALHLDKHASFPEMGHHPLFHLLSEGIASLLWWLPLRVRSHVALRVISAIGLGGVCGLIAARTGPRGWVLGVVISLVVTTTRGFIIDSAIGETIVPAIALALWVMCEATAQRPRAVRLVTSLVAACLFREDNVFVAMAVIPALRRAGWTWKRVALLLAVAGSATLAGYVALWASTVGPGLSLWSYLTFLSTHGSWSEPLSWESLSHHLATLSAGVVGREVRWAGHGLLISAAWAVPLAGVGLMFLDSSGARSISYAGVLLIIARLAVFAWFDVHNWEWWLLPMSVLGLWTATRVRGGHTNSVWRYRIAIVILISLATATLLSHGASTWALRAPRFIRTIEEVVKAGQGCRFIANGPTVSLALEYLQVPHSEIDDKPDPGETIAAFIAELAKHPVPTMFVLDRALLPSDPEVRNIRERRLWIDDLEDRPGLQFIRIGGITVGIRHDP